MLLTWRYVTQNDLGSKVIQRFSAGNASHVGWLTDGDELGARFDRVGGKPPGVQIRPANYSKFASQTFITLDVPDRKGMLFRSFLYRQIGRPYDWRAILGFATGRNWREDDAWICSELQAAAMEYAGICSHLYLTANKITPVAHALIVSALGGQITEGHL